MTKPLLEMKGIKKSFNGVSVLKDVDFQVNRREVVALMGGNGAGKSTLMKILNGVYQADEGEIFLDGEKVEIRNVLDAGKHGIGMIYQEFSLISTLTVAENIFLAHEPRKRNMLLDNRACVEKAKEILDGLGIEIDPRKKVEELSVGYRQIVEIAKALSKNVKILVMDEPTSALTEHETETLFGIVRNLLKMDISVIFISHRMKEIYQICDRITVLRDGKIVISDEASKIPMDHIVSYIVGSAMDKKFEWIPRSYSMEATPALEVRNLTYRERVRDVSFSLYPSEILGIAGLMGSGRTETLLSVFGLLKPDAGVILVNGQECRIQAPEDAMKQGIALIPESRRAQGLVMDHSVKENVLITVLDKIRKYGFLKERQGEAIVEEQIRNLDIKTDHMKKNVCLLSGGNQQKVVISKWLANKSTILMLDEPTAGVDIGAKTEIIYRMRELADQGCAVIFVSSELNELLAVSDRILVLKDGKKIQEIMRKDIEGEEVLQRAIQGYE